MSTIKNLKGRIEALSSTKKISNTMNMIASAKLCHIKKFLQKAKDGKKNISMSFEDILGNTYKEIYLEKKIHNIREKENDNTLFNLLKNQSSSTHKTLIVISSDKGLCSNFNSKINSFLKYDLLSDKKEKFDNYIIIGKKSFNTINKITKSKVKLFNLNIKEENLFFFAEEIFKLFYTRKKNFYIKILYSDFENVVSNSLTFHDIYYRNLNIEERNLNIDDNEAIVRLINKHATLNIYYCLISSRASEESSRMIAMDTASKNCSDFIDDLILKMNKIRQNNITKELIEIISGSSVNQ